MLSSQLLVEKTYENLIQEARNQIPVYTKEWTNFNPSEPAVTILENLSAFSILQQAYIDRMPEPVIEKILAMMGFVKKTSKGARVLLETTKVEEAVLLPAGQKFLVGDMSFETNREFKLLGNHITGVYGKHKAELTDYSYLTDIEVPLSAQIFSKEPKVGDELYFIADELGEAGDEVIFYVELNKDNHRNEFEGSNLFADIKWQCFTEKGFVDIRCRDKTGCFLTSGELRFKLPRTELKVYEELPTHGYAIRGILKRADYDIPPSILQVHGFLFEVWQKETVSLCYTYGRQNSFIVYCDLLEEGYYQIYGLEEQKGSYQKYKEETGNGEIGRFFTAEKIGYGRFRFTFDHERFGYAPGNFDNAVKLVVYNENMMRRFDLDQIYGYDDQEIVLPANQIVRESFSIIAERNIDGVFFYDFIKPDSDKEEEFKYSLNETEGSIVILDAKNYINARLYLCSCAITSGAEGNIRAGSHFVPVGYESDIQFTNPAQGNGGCNTETLGDIKKRFLKDIGEHYTAVGAADYERIIRSTPNLCIHKVKAVADSENNQILVSVKPYADKPFPLMSNRYKAAIMQRIEERRLLTTKVVLKQPVYVEVSVRGTIYVKSHFAGCMEQIEKVIRAELDYISSDKNFGERLNFDVLFHKVESLECVDFIYELLAISGNHLLAVPKGLDIQPVDNCLLYPGEILLEINTMD